MKHIFKTITLVGIMIFSISCSDFLEETPKSDLSYDTNFTAPSHAYSSVNVLYRTGAPSFYGNSGVYMGPTSSYGGFMAGLFDNEYKGQEVICDYSQKLSIDAVNIANQLDGVWRNSYLAIDRANLAIQGIPVTPGLSDLERDQLMGEALFFRAFNYFYLVKFFGDVPLTIEPYTSLENIYLERTPAAQIYTQIVKDLTDAVGMLPNDAFTNNGHRITRTTAETVLADVYLTMSGYPVQSDNYSNAATVARSIINGGKHRLIPHGETPETSAYNKIRTTDNDIEYMYTYEFDPSIATNSLPSISMPNKGATWGVFKYSITNNAYRPIQEYLNVYDSVPDLRMHERQFFHTEYTYEKDGESITEVFPHSPYFWYDETALLSTGRSGKDVAIYRYAEVLLIAAEAIAESEGVTSEAVKYLTDVRARAYHTTPREEIENSLKGLSKEAFVEQVWIERMRELPFEMRIWSDIQRTRKYPVTSESNKGTASFVNVIGTVNPWGQTFEEKHLLYPLSNNELQRNPSLVQNPGYPDVVNN